MKQEFGYEAYTILRASPRVSPARPGAWATPLCPSPGATREREKKNYSFCTVVGGILMCMWPKNKGAPSFSSPSPSPFANGKQLQMGGVQWVLNLDELLRNSCKKILLLLRDLRITLRWGCQVHTRVLLFLFFLNE